MHALELQWIDKTATWRGKRWRSTVHANQQNIIKFCWLLLLFCTTDYFYFNYNWF